MEIAITVILPIFAGFLIGLAINLPALIESRRQRKEIDNILQEQEERLAALVQTSQSFKRK